MQLLQSRRGLRRRDTASSVPRFAMIEPPAHAEPSRHDEGMLTTRIVPRDPYEVWLEQREESRRSVSTRRSADHVGVWI